MQRNAYHHLSWHHGIELFEAAFSTQTFSRHAHEGFAIGAIAEGVGGYNCRGENVVLPAGSLSLMNPEEPHTGYAPAGRVRYNMLYVSENAVRTILDVRHVSGFSTIAPQDWQLRLTRALAALADRLNNRDETDWGVAVEEGVHKVLVQAFSHYGGARLRMTGQEAAAIKRLRLRIKTGVEAGETLTLADLADEARLNVSYMIRSVKHATGLTPHAHILRARVDRARRMLISGTSAAEAAIAAGFCDQAHLIRQFRRHYGVTPSAMIRH
jgi:AraC-like DNA-binding protein